MPGRKAPSNRSVDRKTGGKPRHVMPANEPHNNMHEQQTGRMRPSPEPHGMGGRRRTLGGRRGR